MKDIAIVVREYCLVKVMHLVFNSHAGKLIVTVGASCTSCTVPYNSRDVCLIIIIIYPLTTRVVGAPQMISQQVSSIFPCSPLPSGTYRFQVCPQLNMSVERC